MRHIKLSSGILRTISTHLTILATSDDEFTPTGEKRWSWKKFVKKRNDIAKVIISLGSG